jgi:hypothetical protein
MITVDEVMVRLVECSYQILMSDYITPGIRHQEALDAGRDLLKKGEGTDLFTYEENGNRRILRAVPKVGMGATRLGYTDREPFYIVKVNTPKKLTIRAANAVRDPTWKPDFHPGGFFGHTANNHEQRWTITPGPENAKTIEIRFHKDGHWYDNHKGRFLVGVAFKFYDYNF